MGRVRDQSGIIGERSASLLKAFRARLAETDITKITSVAAGIHKECTHIVEEAATICDAIRLDFFDPPIPRMTQLMSKGEMSQRQG
jgi:hypothetical protein